jgi:hypothetical protein
MGLTDLLPMCRDAPGIKNSPKVRIYVAVADSGHGMSSEEQAHIFQRFSQASPRTYGEFGGHGLGRMLNSSSITRSELNLCIVYISRLIVQLQGGDISLTSVKGCGTVLRFFITLERSTIVSAAQLSPSIVHRTLPSSAPIYTNGVGSGLLGQTSKSRAQVLVVEVLFQHFASINV